MASHTLARRTAAAAGATLAVGAAVTAGFALAPRLRGRRAPGAQPQVVVCACGQAFRVSGIDRHRVYWLAEAAESDPLLGERCPACDRPLPVPGAA